jgi:hypothetical protein
MGNFGCKDLQQIVCMSLHHWAEHGSVRRVCFLLAKAGVLAVRRVPKDDLK